jgi:hypothetical protein
MQAKKAFRAFSKQCDHVFVLVANEIVSKKRNKTTNSEDQII